MGSQPPPLQSPRARQWQKLRFSHFLNFTLDLAANARASRSTGEFGFSAAKINATRARIDW
jgi:hypothetical protein